MLDRSGAAFFSAASLLLCAVGSFAAFLALRNDDDRRFTAKWKDEDWTTYNGPPHPIYGPGHGPGPLYRSAR